ncbi:xanthine dehydrogenase [Arthrobacter sp. SRS-W-1-2016]|uniref:XdhC family protein n=1 Tax=Arthrobacter sp. SRS-W-1-2016 TaxID=1930254 RepID=UPI0009914638|nr:XdhC/CoxI family protein [Arthrobacter sp. SRS-W-1-2016]OOP61372.1 xanthine dehydrogenase [Arthrobacter sp. SRS-W-1-2016]
MLDLMPSLGTWRPAVSGQRCAVATIVAAGGSVPRPLGTSMLVSEHGDVLGSLSGGCVEGAVVEAALQAMHDGGSRLESFGYSAEDAFAVGLTCGGELEIHIQPIQSTSAAGLDLALLNSAGGSSLALIRRLDAAGGAVVVPDPAGFSAAGSRELSALLGGDDAVIRAAAAQLEPLLHGGRAGLVRLAPAEGCSGSAAGAEPLTLFVESRLPAARMLIFGANDFGAALLPAGKLLGYDVTLCDARPAFSSQVRFLAADRLVTDWPHRYLAAEAAAGRIDSRTVVCVLTHDPKFDIPLLETALDLDLAYVGAMGSRRSHRQRIDGLLDCGVPAEALERLHSPIGLDLGAVTPAEVAVSITAEILASRAPHPASARGSLKDGTGPIHRTNTPKQSKVTPWT